MCKTLRFFYKCSIEDVTRPRQAGYPRASYFCSKFLTSRLSGVGPSVRWNLYYRDRRTALGAAIDMRMLLPQRLSAMLCCSAWPGLVPAISRAVSNSLLPQLPGQGDLLLSGAGIGTEMNIVKVYVIGLYPKNENR